MPPLAGSAAATVYIAGRPPRKRSLQERDRGRRKGGCLEGHFLPECAMTKSFRLALALLCFALVFPLYAGVQAAADDVSGTWAFVLNTEGGDRNSNATFKVDGKTVTGTWGDKTEVQGTFADGDLDLSFPFNSDEAGSGTLALKGKLANDELTGTWSFSQYSGTFKATRVPAPAR